ncbi:MAG: hypothetical protein HY800_02090, partial [Ignavibacteriales bacterium]|nr:hypothetical protein [Ignavibacteriales bacterium]
MDESSDIKLTEDLQWRIAEAKQRSFAKESQRLDLEITNRAQELVKSLQTKTEKEFQQKLQQIELERKNEESSLKRMEEEVCNKIEAIIKTRIDARRVEEEAARLKLEEERQRQEELARQRAEEEERKRKEEIDRLKAEEERRRLENEIRRQEEQRRLREEEEHNRLEDERRRQELALKQREDEIKRQEEERQERIRTLLTNAITLYDEGDLEHALVEVAKALVNDPINQEALELETKIKEAQGLPALEGIEIGVEKPRPKQKKRPSTGRPIKPEKKRIPLPIALGAIILSMIIGTIVIVQLTKHVFKFPKTIAVIPWISSANNLEENIIGSSVAEEVTSKFASMSPSAVLDYTSAYKLAQNKPNPDLEIFRLGFSYILKGYISRSGENYTFDLKIVDSLDNVAWTGQITKPPTGFADLPGEIAQRLIKAFDISMPPGETNLKISRTSTNPDAYLFYLRGIELIHRKTPESLSNAYELLLQSIQQDPKFAEGLAAAANVLASKLEQGLSRGDSVVIQAKHLAEAAITANPQLDRGYFALGRTLAYDKNYTLALANFDSATVLAPHNSDNFLEIGKVYLKIGNYNEAFDALNKSFKLNPCDPALLQTYANAFQLIGVPSESMPYHEIAITFAIDSLLYISGPVSNAILVDPDLRLTQNQRVLSACERRTTFYPKDYVSLYNFARLKQVMGYIDADHILSKLELLLQNEIRQNPKNFNASAYLALTLTRLGKFTEAIALSERLAAFDPTNAEVKYKIAQMYSIQMYSQKEKQLNKKKKAE